MPTTRAHEQQVRAARSGRAVDWHSARRRAHAEGRPLPGRPVELAAAAGLVLAEDLVSRVAQPAFDTSAMDGYAVAGRGPWTVLGEVRAGRQWPGCLRPGEAVAISTGAPVPAGARAVLPVEDTSRSGDEVRGLDGCAPEPGRHIRRTGENSPAGALLADSGSVVSPAMLGLAAAAGHDDLVVRPRPRVRLLITGDELVTAGPGGAGRVRDALGPTLPPLVAGLGGDLVETAHVQDSFAALAAAVGSGAASEIVLVTGSTSVGVTDHLHRLLDGLGARAVVDGVTCRPGHPQLLAALGSRRWLIGLPGNPYAAIVAAHTLLAPLLAGLGGRPVPPLRRTAVAGVPPAVDGHTLLVPAAWDGDHLAVVPGHRPSDLRGVARADVLAVIDRETRDTTVAVLSL
ncbi:MoeA domain protein domain I and II [Pseudonocardia dioxanivorans CB1190]|uniref:Molybdopterin molybdenumtransferase n=1 Tax=Pseudonocardia dioxanivorans (strain ATCC 55486 / DSM 44775 / JCM 13855 / CB1190) TaxID=675635 RepID=F4CMH5_PSEUX|nr:molybdopterin-binding protein [Pseudonocardia dioxanivorans]AEA23602.1 MoeA domain protein domain I and II [Pseudonocardia dioxanivorans CB1190]GJF07559.1 molybdopterin molybdenumtransferase MoeA [Pseudonocardia sp. D17]